MAMLVNVSAALETIKVPVARPEIASYRLSIDGPDARSKDFAAGEPMVAAFEAVADGSYTAHAQSLDAGGAVLDDVSTTFEVVTPPTEKDALVPTSINVTVGG